MSLLWCLRESPKLCITRRYSRIRGYVCILPIHRFWCSSTVVSSSCDRLVSTLRVYKTCETGWHLLVESFKVVKLWTWRFNKHFTINTRMSFAVYYQIKFHSFNWHLDRECVAKCILVQFFTAFRYSCYLRPAQDIPRLRNSTVKYKSHQKQTKSMWIGIPILLPHQFHKVLSLRKCVCRFRIKYYKGLWSTFFKKYKQYKI